MRAFLLGLLLFAVPAGASTSPAQPGIENPLASTPTTLWFHLVDTVNDFQVTSQPPDPAFEMTARPGGQGSQTLSCLPEAGPAATSEDWHTFWGISSPGYVRYNQADPTQPPRVHPERGLAYDVLLDGAAPMRLHWTLATSTGAARDGVAGVPNPLDAAVVVPNVAVHAWIRTGDAISIGNQAYREGALVAEGETVGNLAGPLTSTTSSAGSVTASSFTTRDGRELTLYDFELELQPAIDAIPEAQGFNIQVSVFLKSQACPDPSDGALMPNLVEVHSSAAHRPRLEWSILNPLRIHYLHPQIVGKDMVFHTSIASPWGNFDVPAWTEPGSNGTRGGLTLDIVGPGGPVAGVWRAQVVQSYSHVHNNGVLDGADATYVWPFREQGAPDGRYTATFTARNQQNSTVAVATAAFALGNPNELTLCGVPFEEDPFPPREATVATSCQVRLVDDQGIPANLRAPAWPLLGLLAVLLACALAGRRQDRAEP